MAEFRIVKEEGITAIYCADMLNPLHPGQGTQNLLLLWNQWQYFNLG
jgi:hypothetical protein